MIDIDLPCFSQVTMGQLRNWKVTRQLKEAEMSGWCFIEKGNYWSLAQGYSHEED